MAAPSVTVLIVYQARPAVIDEAVQTLRRLIATVVASEPDCHGIRLYQDTADPTRVLLEEQWTSRDAYLGPHLQTAHLQAFIANADKWFIGPPDITFWERRAEERPPASERGAA